MIIEGLVIGDSTYDVENASYQRAVEELQIASANFREFQDLEFNEAEKLLDELSKLLNRSRKAVQDERAKPRGISNPHQSDMDAFRRKLLKLVAVFYRER